MDTERLSHAYIIAGPPEECERRAEELTAAMLCESVGQRKPCGLCRSCRKLQRGVHPDRIVLSRTKDEKGKLRREIYVDQIRELSASAAILPSEAERKVYIIREAGLMNPAAQNARSCWRSPRASSA